MRRSGALVVAAVVAASGCARDASDDGARDAGASTGGAGGTGGVKDADVTPGPGPLRIATFNARNVFNDRIDGEAFVVDEALNTPTSGEYDEKLGRVARIMNQLDADVVVLQEIENRAVLDALAERAELERAYPIRILVAGNDPRGVDLGFLSSVPVVEQLSHKNDLFGRRDASGGPKYQYARDCLEVHLRFGSLSLVLLGVHFKAKRDDDPDKRLAEAQHTRFIADTLTAREPGLGVLVLGDFNDFPGSPPMQAIDGAPPDAYESAARHLPDELAWTVESAATTTGFALHDDLVANAVLSAFLDVSSVDILHDDELAEDLRDVSDHAPVVATYVID